MVKFLGRLRVRVGEVESGEGEGGEVGEERREAAAQT